MKRWQRSLDGHYSCEADVFEPDRYRQIFSLGVESKLAVQGGGVSYVAASFGGGARVINMRRFNRLLSFDPENGTVEAEAGITLGRLGDFLAKRGFTISVQPGHPQITLGGCIAANVHGKHQYRDGLFADLVEQIRLFHPAHSELTLSAEQNSDLLELTCGGYGLTGIILSARIRIEPLVGNVFEVTHIPVSDLASTFARLNDLKESYDFLYSWNDLARFDRHMGRGYLIAGKLVNCDPAPAGPRKLQRLNPNRGSFASLPLINRLTLPTLNAVYYIASRSPGPNLMDLTRALYPAADKTYYFSAYGRTGFIEHQILVPDERMYDYLGNFEALVRRRRQPFGLTSLKLFCGHQKLLHYNGTGVSFSLHLPNRPKVHALLDELDELNSSYGVITNLIKDSRLSATTARCQYPEFEKFTGRLGAFDSRRLFVTALSERMAL